MFMGFGEVMMRVNPQQKRRWRQALPGNIEVTWGGGEANVCASLAMYGQPVRYLTALPSHPIADSLVASLQSLGIDTHCILRREGRLGIYFVEVGANQRGSTVLYDRSESSVSLAVPEEYDFDTALENVTWVHVTGITPAISREACRTNLEMVKRAKQLGAKVSCDLNFRKKLWNWDAKLQGKELARLHMSELLPYVDLVIGNEEDASDVLDIHAENTNVHQGQINATAYEDVAKKIVDRFPSIEKVAITLRESISADHNNWGALLFDVASNSSYLAPVTEEGLYQPFQIGHIVDRIGAGDSFAAGLLHALHSKPYSSPELAIRFAVAASCLKHSIQGDFNYVSESEVAALISGNVTGRVQR